MEKSQRTRIIASIRYHNQQYLNSVVSTSFHSRFQKKITILTRKTQSLIRKEYGSQNSISELLRLGRLIAGFTEDIHQSKAPPFNFIEYEKVINEYLINYLDTKRKTNYNRQCASYGETLFVLYLDPFITATIHQVDRELQANPSFLVNPKTGSILEIDVLFEDFNLAFEFQGEHHYFDPKTQEKDIFKLNACLNRRTILIPVNISQLNSKILQSLIINSIKDFLGIHDLFATGRDMFEHDNSIKSKQLLNFCKITERLYTSATIFNTSTIWLDAEATKYINKIKIRSPISSTSAAPRQTSPQGDFDIITLYRGLKHVSAFRKVLRDVK